MIFVVCLLLIPLVFHRDPAPGLGHSRSSSRNLDCESLSAEQGLAQRPGEVPVSKPRGDYVERSAVICSERLLRPGLRAPRDEAILSTLDALSTELASNAASRRPDLAGRTWHVETFYPDAQVSAKLSFATKNALVRQGLAVSDRTPVLGAGDIDVLTRLDPEQAYFAACQRYHRTGALGEGHALLAVVSRDERETALHAGLCVDGAWTWLQ